VSSLAGAALGFGLTYASFRTPDGARAAAALDGASDGLANVALVPLLDGAGSRGLALAGAF
jgi:hypothetical protein